MFFKRAKNLRTDVARRAIHSSLEDIPFAEALTALSKVSAEIIWGWRVNDREETIKAFVTMMREALLEMDRPRTS